ncbi:MAG TPA: S-layer homology domain-containing protein [Bacillus sp. (in: firmicutes)]|nr:S-layer homology domain-containing protein [Bacillus sp. (in: firmicutes)]
MKNAAKVVVASAVLVSGLGFGTASYIDSFQPNVVQAQTQRVAKFKDISSDFWARETIAWAYGNYIIDGYKDNTFRPNNKVTEAQFVKMVLLAYVDQSKMPTITGKHWAENFYQYAKKMGYPVLGLTNQGLRDKPVTREKVAEIITATQGVNYSKSDAIKYLIGNNLSTGKTSATVEGFDGKGTLTRAQAVRFIKNMKDFGKDDISARPSQPSSPSELPDVPEQEPEKPKGNVFAAKTPDQLVEVLNNMESLTEKSIVKKGYQDIVGVDLTGTYKNMGDPVISLDIEEKEKRIYVHFDNKFDAQEKAFAKEILSIYYPQSYEQAYNDLINVKDRSAIEKNYEGKYYMAGLVIDNNNKPNYTIAMSY